MRRRGVAVLLLALGGVVALRLALQAAVWLGGFESFTADEFARVLVAARWAETGAPVSHGPWPPLHFYVLGAALRAHWDLVATPRAVATIAGLATLLLAYGIGARLAGRGAGVVAALALAVHPSHVWLASTPLSEGLYACAWFASVLCAMRFAAARRPVWLVLAAVACAAAGAIRLEGWIVSALLAFLVAGHLWRERRTMTLEVAGPYVLALVAVAAFPLAWLASNASAEGAALGFVAQIERYKQHYAALHDGWAAGPTTWARLVAALDPLVVPAALAGAVLLARRRSEPFVFYVLLGVAPLVVFLAGHFGHVEPWRNHVRYLSPYLWMLVPLAASGAVLGYDAARRLVAWRPAVAGALGAFALALQLHRVLAVENDPSAAGLAVGRELARLRGPDRAGVLLEVDYFQFLAVHVGAHDVRRIVYDRTLDGRRLSAVRDATSGSWADAWRSACGGLGTATLKGAWLERCLRARGVGFVVAREPATRARLEHELGLAPERERNGYAIYAVPPELRGPEVAVR